MKRFVAALATGCMFMASGFVQAAEKSMYQEVTENKPEVGVSTTVFVGDRMLEQRTGQYQDCIVPKFESSKNWIGSAFIVKPDIPLCKGDQKDDKYRTSAYLNSTTRSFGVRYVVLDNQQFKLCLGSLCTEPRDAAQVDVGPRFIAHGEAPQRAVEYAGRMGDFAKFNYVESTDGFIHQTITREFQIDLTQGKVAAYKGAIIEIESATSSSITYKLVRNFQQ